MAVDVSTETVIERPRYTWTDAGPDRTRMTLRNTGTPSGFGNAAAPIMEAAMRRVNRADPARLRALLEA
ncbi:hypothetical protein [Nocardia anaemiae]|uniref:hypothetical protein n=1 Tax=Nocardia anaemiae TaxID=263910 RepID=UPI0007A51D5C|nr:hypothetical protein [Nocardia anaemiae]